tara:strand:+ start:15853 stop:16512 length:660 start_codon:yes stop_codon:yes gene_type:complete
MNKGWNSTIKHEVYSSDCYGFKKINFNRSPLHIVDIGSNYGWFSVLAAEKYPDCNIYAYELIERNYLAAKQNLENFKNANVFNAGVTGKNRISKILEAGHNDGGHKPLYAGKDSYISEERFKNDRSTNIIHENIPDQISIKEIFDINNIDYIDFLKLDCEGCEYEIFDQIFEYDLDKKIKNLAMEVHGKGHPEYKKLEKQLQKRFSTLKWGKITHASNE